MRNSSYILNGIRTIVFPKNLSRIQAILRQSLQSLYINILWLHCDPVKSFLLIDVVNFVNQALQLSWCTPLSSVILFSFLLMFNIRLHSFPLVVLYSQYFHVLIIERLIGWKAEFRNCRVVDILYPDHSLIYIDTFSSWVAFVATLCISVLCGDSPWEGPPTGTSASAFLSIRKVKAQLWVLWMFTMLTCIL